MLKKYLILFLLFLFSSFSYCQNAIDITNKMFEKSKSVKTLSLKIISKERIGTEFKIVEAKIKKQISPVKIYYKQLKPPTNAEVLINEKYSKKALVSPKTFPWINLELDPMGTILREAQHHSIYEAGFDYFIQILGYLLEKNKETIKDLAFYKGEITLDGIICYKIELNNPSFKIISYKVKENCNVTSLARKLHISEYHIIERNPKFKEFNELVPIGTVLNITNDYAKKLTMLIDKSTYLPIFIEVYDDKGLFEQYKLLDVKINPPFTEADFNENNKNYGFK